MTVSVPLNPAKMTKRFAWALLLLFPLLLVTTRAGMDIGLSLIGVCFLCSSVMGKDFGWLRQVEMRFILLLWAYVALSSLRLTWTDAGNAAGWVRFVLFYAAIRYWLLTSRQRLEQYALWLLAVLSVVLVDTYVQYYSGTSLSGRAMQQYQRLTGPLKHANIGNYFLKIVLPLMGVWLAFAVQRGKKYQAAIVVFLAAAVCIIPLSGERTITMLLLVATGIIAGLCFLHVRQYRRGIVGISVLLVAGALLLIYTQPVIGMRFGMLEQHVEEFETTPYGQLFLGASQLIREHPLFGIGYEQYYEECIPLQQKGLVAYCDIHPHNTYLQWLVETGVIGFGLFLGFIIVLGRQWWRAFRTVTLPLDNIAVIAAGAGLVVCFFPLSITQSVFSNWSAGLMWFSLGLAAAVFSVFSDTENV